MKVVILLLLFSFRFLALGQLSYNACNTALEICPNQSFSLSNVGANKTLCPGCEDDFAFCFTSNNSIWMTFTTNSTGGGQAHNNMQPTLFIGNMFIFAGTRDYRVDPISVVG